MTVFFKALLWAVTLSCIVVRVLNIGWLLVLLGIVLVAVVAAELYVGSKFIAVALSENPSWSNIVLFAANLLAYIVFVMSQTDFGDTQNSVRVTLQIIAGKNDFTAYVRDRWVRIMAWAFAALLASYAGMLYVVYSSKPAP